MLRCTFAAKVELLLVEAPELHAAIAPLLEARNVMRKQKVVLDRRLHQMARSDEVCKRLMTVPGVGPIISLAYKATIDDPSRFKSSKAVAAHIGLTPRVYQSGEIDRSGNIRNAATICFDTHCRRRRTRTCASARRSPCSRPGA